MLQRGAVIGTPCLESIFNNVSKTIYAPPPRQQDLLCVSTWAGTMMCPSWGWGEKRGTSKKGLGTFRGDYSLTSNLLDFCQ